jgi:hypothetical protein
MKTFIPSAALAAALLATTGAHAQPAKPAQQCFRTSQIDNYTATDDEQTLYVRSGRDTFKIDFGNRCTGLAFRQSIVLKSVGTSNLVCRPIDLDFGIRDTGMYTRCIATDIRALTPDEVAALPKKLKP